MPTITIDNKQITVDAGTPVIEAARKLGIEVPHYCYHPKLSISGNCRMCLVEVEKMPKPQISCSLIASDGMVVKTQSENAKKWRKNVLEFILVNHPLDCPVCDQAGECKLQEYYLSHSVKGSQFTEDKVHKPKRFQLGPQVVLDDERCIMCSRCVRFCDEISKTSELGFIQRGDHTELRPFPGKQLDNPYSINTVDICPVGALTSEDFRFKKRVWFLESASSICSGCSRGCNIKLQSHQGVAYRYLPRQNDLVNEVWLCDAGRLSYKEINENRLIHCEKKNNSKLEIIHPTKILEEITEILKKISIKDLVIIGSAQNSNENNFAIKKFSQTLGATSPLFYSKREVLNPFEDEILIKADKNPNARGSDYLGLLPMKQFSNTSLKGKIIFILGEISDADREKLFKEKPEVTVVFSTHKNKTTELADYLFPITTFAEEIGSFTNFEGRVQKFAQALKPRGDMKPIWIWLKEIARQLNHSWSLNSAEDFLREAFKLSYKDLGEEGKIIS